MQLFFVENLTRRTWIRFVWPRIKSELENIGDAKWTVYYVDGKPRAIPVARKSIENKGGRLEQLDFDLCDIRDEEGRRIWSRIYFRDLLQVLDIALELPEFKQYIDSGELSPAGEVYFRKQCLPGIHISNTTSLWKAIYLTHVIRWKIAQFDGLELRPLVFFNRRVWFDALAVYAAKPSVFTLIPFGPPVDLLSRFTSLAYSLLVSYTWKPPFLVAKQFMGKGRGKPSVAQAALRKSRAAIECYGHFNLDNPQLYSDFFFWQQSQLPGSDIYSLFNLEKAALNAERLSELEKHGIEAIVLQPQATTLPDFPVHQMGQALYFYNLWKGCLTHCFSSVYRKWLREKKLKFDRERDYWAGVLNQHGVKVYTTWYKYDAGHCMISEAMRQIGGILGVYQRSYEGLPSAQFSISADIFFAFSASSVEVDRRSFSQVKQYVITGYLGDHRFPLLQEGADKLRRDLLNNGAARVVAVFDENSAADKRWLPGHEHARAEYEFWLEKIFSDSRLGLIFKPKNPGTLRERLGSTAHLLDRAIETGRCYIYDKEFVTQGSVPPVQAALAADIAVHSSVFAATAGVEAALAGVPTLIVDHDGLIDSPLYRQGVGRSLFTDFDATWNGCCDFWNGGGRKTGIGDWGEMLDEFDPFRDGRAAERMGNYVYSLCQLFDRGASPEEALAEAGEKYRQCWGEDKIRSDAY